MNILAKCVLNNVTPLRVTGCRLTSGQAPELDKLFENIKLEYRGHDPAVLQSYSTFLTSVCKNLRVESTPVKVYPYVRWVECLLRSKFVHKKYKLHYETRTYIRELSIKNVTGSTASTLLEYVQRNIPEGVAMKVDYTEISQFPTSVSETMAKIKKERDDALRK
uniref:Ribosomal_S10 domain-containing protein n=1 Tax=Rhabditophanes sp. KR3021 TaxID=114890 RepID=A0AC35TM32_9BILA